MMWWPGYGWGWGWGWMLLGWLIMVAFWGGLIALIVWAVSRLVQRPSISQPQSPLDIIKARYARGEISKEEFERLKKDLS